MPYCIHCGVKLDHRNLNCPLCLYPVEFPEKRVKMPPLYPKEVNKISIIKGQTNARDWNFLNLFRFIIILGLLITTALDLYLNNKLGWSLITSLSQIYFYISITIIIHFKKNLGFLYGYLNAVLGFFLFFLDLLISKGSWFIPYALPCFSTLQLSSLIIKILFKFIKLKIIRAVLIILIANIFLIMINLLTTNKISWSLIITSIFIPTALYLFYLNRVIKVKSDYPQAT